MKNRIYFLLLLAIICTTTISSAANKIQISLILDTSNSMDGLIDQAKGKLWSIVNELSKCKKDGEDAVIQIALYEFGNDNLEEKDNWIRLVLPFTEDLDKISERLFKLRTKGGNEYCGAVIAQSIKDLEWSSNNNDLKMIIIAGNEAFNQGGLSYTKAIDKAVKEDIIINTIYCGDYETGVNLLWKDGSVIGNGSYSNIDQEQSLEYIATPYDDEIYKLNKALNNTYIQFGTMGNESKARQEVEDNNAESFSKANAVDRAVSKASTIYKSSEWDLVDAYDNKKEIIKNLDKQQLPQELRGKSTNEIETYILVKKEERKKIQSEILEFQNKRMEHIKSLKQKGEALTLEEAFMISVKEAAELKGFIIEQ